MLELAELLARRGSAFLGAGDFSVVVADPECPDTVIKIGHSLSDGWPAWAAFAVEHGGLHVPVVHALRWIWSRSGAPLFYMAEIERLEPADEPRGWLAECPEGKRMPCALGIYLDERHPAIAAMLRAARRLPGRHLRHGQRQLDAADRRHAGADRPALLARPRRPDDPHRDLI